MVSTIDMQDMRYLNLFEKITRIRTRFCFKYNETIFFCVPKRLISRAVGENGKNVREISKILGRKIKIIFAPNDESEVEKFISAIIEPVEFKEVEINDEEIVLNAGARNKAALIGRNKRRLNEMKKIVESFFNKEFRIV